MKFMSKEIDRFNFKNLLLRCFAVTVGYVALAWIGYWSSINPNKFVTFWFPSGFYLAILFTTKVRQWPYVVVAAIIGNISFDLMDGKPLWLTLIFSSANSVDALVGVFLFRRFVSSVPAFKKTAEIVLFFIINVIGCPAISATIGAFTLHNMDGAPLLYLWLTWWSGTALGIITLTPLILMICKYLENPTIRLSFWRWIEFLCMVGSVIVFSWLIFSGVENWIFSQKYLMLYILIWAILRFGLAGVVIVNALIAITFIYCPYHYSEVENWSNQFDPTQESISIQIFLFTVYFTSLFVAVVIDQRNQLMKDVSLSEFKFKSLINSASDAIFIHSLNGCFLDVNEETCKRLGLSRSELLKRNINDFVSLKFVSGVMERIKSIEMNGKMYMEIEYINKYGESIPTEINSTLIDYGDSKAILAIARDLTDRRSSEKRIKENEERYSLVIKASNDGIWDWDLTTNYVYYSPKWKEMIGYEDDELENNLDTWLKTIHPEDLVTVQQLLKEHFETDKSFHHTSRFWHKDGSIRWIQVKGFALRDDKGQPYRMIGNHTDITEKKLADDKLRESELRFRVSFQTSPDAIVINRLRDGLYMDINDGFSRLTGWLKEELQGKTPLDINIWENTTDRNNLLKSLKKDGYVDNLETQFKIKNGSLRTCLMSAQLINIHGEDCVLSMIRDITNLKITEGQLLEQNATIEEQNRVLTESFEKIQLINEELTKAKEKAEESDYLKSAFLANMSHELRTPLNTILGFSDLLNSKELPPEKSKKFAQIINKRGNDLLVLVNDLLDISKIEAGQMDISESLGNLKDFMIELHQNFVFKKEEKASKPINFRYIIDVPEKNWNVSIDFNHLKQILINLLGNAFKFTSTGFIEFGCSQTDQNEILFFVKDSGIGIPKDKVGVIFERFRQASDTYLSNEGGAGLGLSIAKALVELQGGKIWVESIVGEGSCFYFTLPFKPTLKEID